MISDKKLKVAVNGFGRIGRAFFRAAKEHPEIELVAVNDLGERANMEYLLSHDTVYGRSDLSLDGVQYLSEKEPSKLPWKKLAVDVVVEATGFFASVEKARAHLEAGAKRVVVTAPIKETDDKGERGERGATVLMGVNESELKGGTISSNASCTTNAASPIIAILDEHIGIEKALLNTVHAYTATQALVDSPAWKKGLREGRAAAQNIIPSSTGAAAAVTKAYPALLGRFDGISLRVPVICGSIADITFIAKRDTTAEEVNDILRKAAKEPRWQGLFSASDDELVSSDIIGSVEGAIAELSMTRVVGPPAAPGRPARGTQTGAAQAGGNLVKVLAWYDNESGYAHTLVKHVLAAGEHL